MCFDELKSFRTWLKWMYVDQYDARGTYLSWSGFVVFVLCELQILNLHVCRPR